MADLVKLAKDGKITDFEKEWASQNRRQYPLNSSDGTLAQADYYRYRSYNNDKKPDEKGTTDFIGSIASVQSMSSKLTKGGDTDIVNIEAFTTAAKKSIIDMFSEKGGLLSGATEAIKVLGGKLFDGAIDIATKEKELRAEINSELGVAGELSKNYRQEIINSLPAVVAMGYGFEHVSGLMVGLAEETGRFTTLNEDVIRKTAITSRAFVGDLTEMSKVFSNFEKVGIGAENTVEAINEAGKSSLGLGLNAKKTVDGIRENISRLNEYGFQNGIKGLSSMIQKSTEFRMNMNEVFKIADKVMDPDGAISLAANLQVLGGAIGDFGDPLKMMYDATNNVEGLQDALIGAAGSLATYNSEQGRFEITGANLRRAKAMAQELGVSYDELSKGAIAAAERSSAAADLMSSGLSLDEEKTRFITNLARMKDGKMIIDVSSISKEFGGATQVALDSLTDEQVKMLEKNQDALKSMSVEEIARDQFTATQNLVLQVSEIGALLKVQFAAAKGVTVDKMDNYIKAASEYLNDAKNGKEGNAAGELVAKLKAGDLSSILKTSDAYVKSQTPLTVDNSPKKTETTTTTTPPSSDPMEMMNKFHLMTKNDSTRSVNITNVIDENNPLSYTYKIGGK